MLQSALRPGKRVTCGPISPRGSATDRQVTMRGLMAPRFGRCHRRPYLLARLARVKTLLVPHVRPQTVSQCQRRHQTRPWPSSVAMWNSTEHNCPRRLLRHAKSSLRPTQTPPTLWQTRELRERLLGSSMNAMRPSNMQPRGYLRTPKVAGPRGGSPNSCRGGVSCGNRCA